MNSKRLMMAICLFGLMWTVPVAGAGNDPAEKVLIFTKTLDYRHESTEVSIVAISKLCEQNGILVDATEDSEWFRPEKLREYAAVIFLNSSGDVFNDAQQDAFRNYIRGGGGFVGIHGASTTEYAWDWFGRFVGAYFAGHPEPQPATLIVHDTTHISTCKLPRKWTHFEEWYNFRWVDQDFNLLLTVDESTYHGGHHPDHHPISWYKPFEGGRMFYTALGHGEECYADKHFLEHILGGILYAINRTPTG
ncbi:ThuA domain-containing protein [Parapedobacter sp. 2B3]|uniref:ThuA domain-containing protein n=1 Tax=Parapedobacter sp. 2B3 TaxID=3342381 RepID=UPI0035B67BC6